MASLLGYRLKGITMTGLPMLFNAVQVAKIMGVSKSQVYNLMNSGRLGSVSIGRSRRVTNNQMNEFITSLTPEL
jgi:excisionase family DNA binding protein